MDPISGVTKKKGVYGRKKRRYGTFELGFGIFIIDVPRLHYVY